MQVIRHYVFQGERKTKIFPVLLCSGSASQGLPMNPLLLHPAILDAEERVTRYRQMPQGLSEPPTVPTRNWAKMYPNVVWFIGVPCL